MKFFRFPKLRWLNNSAGEADAMLTFATLSFLVTSMAVVCSFIDRVDTVFGSIAFAEANVPLLTLYFGGAFTSYIIRRTTKDKVSAEIDKIEAQNDGIIKGE